MKHISVTLMKLDEFNEIVVGYLFPGVDPFLSVTKYVSLGEMPSAISVLAWV